MSSGRNDSRRSSVLKRSLPGIVAALLVLIGFAIWSAGLRGPYQFDDYVTPIGDPASQSLAAWKQYLSLTLRPVTKLSYALEAEAGWTDQPTPRRVVSIILLMVAAALLYQLTALVEPRAAPLTAAFLAAVWFLHPVQADSVLLVSGRTALLSAVFLLAALLALERSRPVFSAQLFVLACLSRETALAGLLPLVVIAASRPGVSMRSALRQLAPTLAGAALVVLWILTTPRYLHLAEFSFLGRPFWLSFISQVGAVPAGLELLVRPAQLSIDYGIPLPTAVSDPLFLLGLGMYLAAAAGVLLLLRHSRTASIGLALWLAALLPTQSVIPKLDALTNRPLSLALAGLLLVAAPILAAALGRVRAAPRQDGARNAGLVATGASALALCAVLGTATVQRASLFQSELSLWQDAAAKSSTNARPHVQYAILLNHAGRKQEALEVLVAARSIDRFSSQIDSMTKAYKSKMVSQ